LIADSPRPRRTLDRWVWIDGDIRRGEDAVLSVFDRGARDGEGLLETLRIYGGEPYQWSRHLERLVVSAAELGFPVPPSPRFLREGLAQLLVRTGLAEAAARITVTRATVHLLRGEVDTGQEPSDVGDEVVRQHAGRRELAGLGRQGGLYRHPATDDVVDRVPVRFPAVDAWGMSQERPPVVRRLTEYGRYERLVVPADMLDDVRVDTAEPAGRLRPRTRKAGGSSIA